MSRKQEEPHPASARPLRPWLVTAVACALGGAAPVPAFEFSSQDGELRGSFDTTISLGALWRMEDRDPALISIVNGGTSRDPNADDGNLNYDRGDLVSSAVKVTHDLEFDYRNFGGFLRASYFYDDAIWNKDALSRAARDEAGRDAEILDAFVRGRFEVGGRDLNLRAGRQVVSWGESTFIQNGINVLNPINVTRLRIPGSELREGLMPVGMLWGSHELTDNVAIEGVWIAEWDNTRLEPVGTFFSTNDFVATGGSNAYTGYGRRNDANGPAGVFPLSPTARLIAPRSADREPDSGDEFGFALRTFAPDLNFTEFGFYFLNYHSRTPFVSGYRGGITTDATIIPGCRVFDVPTFGQAFQQTGDAVSATNVACQAARGLAARSGASPQGSYFVEYPEDIQLLGVSFNTAGPADSALQGEYSYRRNQPVQLPSAEILNAALGLANQVTSTNPNQAFAVPYGEEIQGYRRVGMHQLQLTGTKAVPQFLGADQLVLVGELGYTRLELPSDLEFAAPGCHLPQPGSSAAASFGSTDASCFATKDSWGYRLLGRLEYPNALGAATLLPRLGFSHDVSGRGPSFNAGAKALTLGLGVNYLQRWQADIAYTAFFGGREISGTDPAPNPAGQPRSYASSTHPLSDRDFLQISVSYSF
jgi:hypothetical protein